MRGEAGACLVRFFFSKKTRILRRPWCVLHVHPPGFQLSIFVRSLNELVLDQNLLSVLPTTLWDLKLLQTLKVARNRLALPPDKVGDMRALILAVSTSGGQKIVLR